MTSLHGILERRSASSAAALLQAESACPNYKEFYEEIVEFSSYGVYYLLFRRSIKMKPVTLLPYQRRNRHVISVDKPLSAAINGVTIPDDSKYIKGVILKACRPILANGASQIINVGDEI